MANAAVVECYATLVDPFGSTAGRPSPHRGADYRRSAGQTVVAYEKCTVINSDLHSSYLGYSLVAQRARDGKYIGWAHLLKGTRPGNGTVLEAGDKVGLVAGFNDDHGSSWSGPHIHTTEGTTADHIYQGQNSDPAPDIAAARAGTAGGGDGGNAAVNYHWFELTKQAMLDLQRMMNVLKIFNGVDGSTGKEDGDFGPGGVKGMQELGKRWGFLAGDYKVDGVPHNLDQTKPSNYGYFLQRWAKAKAGYDGKEDGLPGSYTSLFLSKAANQVIAEVTGGGTPPTPPDPTPVRTPDLPVAPEGFIFFPDLGTSQGDFDVAEFVSKGGGHAFLKAGGSNAGDSPYIAPRYQDQLDRFRANNCKVGHYWFNGAKNGLTPETSVDFWAKNLVLKIGEVVAFDVEHETATGTVAWTPQDVVRAINRLRTYFKDIIGLIYASDSMLDDPAWQIVWDLGWAPWDASWGSNNGDPGTPPTTSAPIVAWQYTSEEKVPGNYSGNPKVYLRTDGNLGKVDLWDRFGWKIPAVDPDPEPEPEPEPGDDETRKVLHDFLADSARLATEYAAVLAP
jgi:hypothetical protein